MVINEHRDATRDYYIDFDGYSRDLFNEGFGTSVVVKEKA